MDTNSTEKSSNKDENLNDINLNNHDKIDDKLNDNKLNKDNKLLSLFKKKNREYVFDENEKIDCISKVIGAFGPWQKRFVIFYMINYLISPFQNYGIVFYAARAKYWCADDMFKNLTQDERELITNKCIPGCKTYEHDRSLYHTTIINEWNLICDDAWLVSTAASVYQVGYALSSIIVGYLSDRYGRAPVFKGILFLEILAGYGQSFAPNIYIFLVSRCVLGIAAYGRFLTGVLLIMETVGPKKRSVLSIMVENSWYIGHYIMIVFFYYLPNFRWVQATVTSLQIIGLFYLEFVPESIRWNIVKGNYDQAKQTLRTAATMKYKNVDPEILENRIDKLINHFEEEEKKERGKKKTTIFQLWGVPRMLGICLILYLCWFTNHLIGYATIFNATNFGENLYINMTVFTTASFGANTMLYLIIERLKRRTLSRIAYLFMIFSCFCLAISFYLEENQMATDLNALNNNHTDIINTNIPLNLDQNPSTLTSHQTLLNNIYEKYKVDLRSFNTEQGKPAKPASKDNGHLRLWLGMILKYATSTCYHTIYVLSVESFPTIIRQLSVGTCSVASRFASIIAPFTKELSNIMGLSFTFGLFTTLAICAFTAIFFIPETRGKEIPDTLNQCVRSTLIKNDLKEEKGDKKEKKNLVSEEDGEENNTSV